MLTQLQQQVELEQQRQSEISQQLHSAETTIVELQDEMYTRLKEYEVKSDRLQGCQPLRFVRNYYAI